MTARALSAAVLHGEARETFDYDVQRATAGTQILLDCPGCGTTLKLGPRTGAHDFNLPWLTSQCPTCGARFGVVQRIEITWDGGAS